MSAPITLLERQRELRELREDRDRAKRILKDVLQAAYGTGLGDWARTSACHYLGHPSRTTDGADGPCVCERVIRS